MLSALLVAACDSKRQRYQSPVEWQLSNGESLAYRISAEWTTGAGGDQKDRRNSSGYLFVDVDSDGEARIHQDVRHFGLSSMELKPGGSNYFFPLPESSLTGNTLVQSLTIKGLGSRAASPDIKVSETLTKIVDDGKVVRLNFSRTGKVTGHTTFGEDLEEEGHGTFDLTAGRYERLERTTKTKSGPFGGANATLVRLTLEFDLEQSKVRTKRFKQFHQPPISAEALDEYLKVNPAESEIAKAVRDLHNGVPRTFLSFHLRANPLATWKRAMAMSPGEQRVFANGALKGHLESGERLQQELVSWLKSELQKSPALENAVAGIQDERLREQLISLTSLNDPQKDGIVRRAVESLEVIDAQKAGPSVLLNAEGHQFTRFGLALQAEGQDYRALVPVLIQVLEKALASPSASFDGGDFSARWLQNLMLRPFGKDAEAWKGFWEANKTKPYCHLIIESAGLESEWLANKALSKLATCHDSREVTDYLAARVENDRGETRHFSALSLAEHRDKRAIPVLIDLLAGDNQQLQAMALVALANFHNTTLGYTPENDDESRAAALRRWRAWATSSTTPIK